MSNVSDASGGYVATPDYKAPPDVRSAKPVTIADVAEKCGCSITTVSQVINRVSGARISKALRKRVENIAQELNYQPNRMGRALASRRTMIVALVTDFQRAVFPIEVAQLEIISGIQAVLRPTEYDLALIHRHKGAAIARSRGVDGVILLSPESMEEVQPFIDSNTALVVLEAAVPMPVATVGIDEAQAVRLAIEHLIGLGHRRIGYFGIESSPSCMGIRSRSYHETMAAHGLEVVQSLLFHLDDLEEKLESCPEAVRRDSITGIVCMTDGLAVKVMNRLRREGILAPRDVSVVGIDGSVTSQISIPPLTTIYNPLLERSSRAAEMLLGRIEDPRRPVEHITFGVSLIRRESSGPPASGD